MTPTSLITDALETAEALMLRRGWIPLGGGGVWNIPISPSISVCAGNTLVLDYAIDDDGISVTVEMK